ncbi:uncharacterized protein [Drosophila virilis]|uniref:uncharacterized protein n=1 Tax=Drosophila virilis TaxID=7244 RepID=UPI0038B34634
MSRASPELSGYCKYFLPHHCVLKEDSTTTKLRVVFDDSPTPDSGHSLNDVLMAGPIIQPKLFHILIRFRTYPVALTADICKMYRCVRVTSADSYFQCILWRDSPQKDIEIFNLDTVTYKTKSASFQSVRAMHQLAFDERDAFPIVSDAIKQDSYVDDLISGANSIAEARKFARRLGYCLVKTSSFESGVPVTKKVVLFKGADVEIHGHCDASVEAYGACIYVVARSPLATSRILCSKSRVAPLKTLTVPKLELCGAKLLASLMHEVKRTDIFVRQFYCWCDSSVVLDKR